MTISDRKMPYKPIGSLKRGLQVLSAYGEKSTLTINEASKITGINRTTLYRIMETLVQEGYAFKSEASGFYRLTVKVRSLSDGFDDEKWIIHIAAPVLGKLLQKVTWPTDLATFDGEQMVIRETTHRFSPLSFHKSMVGRHWPLLTSSMGRAYFCFSDKRQRENILRRLEKSDMPENDIVHNQPYLENLVKETRKRGYAQSIRETDERVSSIALPVKYKGRVLGSINLVFLASVMTPEKAATQYLGDLRDAVAEIEEMLASGVHKQD